MDGLKPVNSNAIRANNHIHSVIDNGNSANFIDIATLPFSGEDGDEKIVMALEEVLTGGKAEDKEKVCMALLASCQDNDLPESTRQHAKSFLLRFLEAIVGTVVSEEGLEPTHKDVDQLIEQSLKKLVDKKFQQINANVRNQELCEYCQRCDGPLEKKLLTEKIELIELQTKAHVKEIQHIYTYQTSPEHADNQLLDDIVDLAGAFGTKNIHNLGMAEAMCQFLFESTENITVKEEASSLLKLFSEGGIGGGLVEFLLTCANIDKRPKSALWLGKVCFGQFDYNSNDKKALQNSIKYLSLAVAQGYSDAINFVSNLAKLVDFIKTTELLREFLQETPIAGIDNRKLSADLEQRAKDIDFGKKYYAVCRDQNSRFSIDINWNIEQRVALARSYLKGARGVGFTKGYQNNPVFTAIIILESLSKLDDPRVLKAKETLDEWLNSPRNRLWLINQCGTELAGYQTECDASIAYKNLFEAHIGAFLQQVQQFNEQENKAKAQQLVYQLIDAAIALEHVNLWRDPTREVVCSSFYQLVLDSSAIDQVYKDELAIRHGLCKSKKDFSHDRVPNCLIDAANTPGRPNAAYQVGRIYFPFPNVDMNYYKIRYKRVMFEWSVSVPITNAEMARNIQQANHYFQKAADEGCSLLNGELNLLSDVIKEHVQLAASYLDRYKSDRNRKDREMAIDYYYKSTLAGDLDAKVQYQLLSDPDMKDKDTQFELGKLYLVDSKLVKQNVEEAQKRLESAAKNGHIGAAILVAQHYLPNTPHQAKFQPGFFENSRDKANEFLKIAVELSFKNGERDYAENGIRVYLNDIVDQLDPAGIEMIFDLSEEYEKMWFPNENEIKLANDLLNAAAGKGHEKAVKKKQKLLEKIDEQNLAAQKAERSIDWNFNFRGLQIINNNELDEKDDDLL